MGAAKQGNLIFKSNLLQAGSFFVLVYISSRLKTLQIVLYKIFERFYWQEVSLYLSHCQVFYFFQAKMDTFQCIIYYNKNNCFRDYSVVYIEELKMEFY